MNIDPGSFAAIVTLMLAMFGLAAWVGKISERVVNLAKAHDTWRTEAREDLKAIYERLDDIARHQ